MSEHFSLKDFTAIKRHGDMQFSPDGQSIVYVLQRYDAEKERFYTDLQVYSCADQRTMPLTSSGNNTSPRYSPDGEWLAFLSSRENNRTQLFLLSIVHGGEARCLPTPEIISSFAWSSDSQHILYSAEAFPFAQDETWLPYPGAPEEDRDRLAELSMWRAMGKALSTDGEEASAAKPKISEKDREVSPRVITRFSYRRDGSGYFGHTRTQNFLMDVPAFDAPEWKPNIVKLTDGDWNHHLGSLAPNAPWLVVASQHRPDPELAPQGQLWLYRTDIKADPVLLLEAPGSLSDPQWSPDGRYIACAGHDYSQGVSTTTDLLLLDLDPVLESLAKDESIQPLLWDAVHNITKPFDRPLGAGGSADIHYMGGRRFVWLENKLYFLMSSHGAGYVYCFSNGQCTCLVGEDESAITGFAVTKGSMAVQKTSPDLLEEIMLLGSEEARRITTWNETFYTEREWAKTEKRFFNCPDDQQELEGWLTYPLGYEKGKLYPLIHIIHGGPHGVYGPAFSFSAQYFAAQGYFVAMMNPRGSVSYGQEFACCIDGDWGNRDMADVLAALDDALSTGDIDPARCFAYGWSYGGYMTCWLTTQTTRYRAIVTGAPVSDLYSDYGIADITMANEWEYGGKPWENATELHSRSALAYAPQAETPLLMLHGEGDFRCNIVQTEQFYQALKRLGKTVVMVRYPGEPHGLRRMKNHFDRYTRIVSWFKYYEEHPRM